MSSVILKCDCAISECDETSHKCAGLMKEQMTPKCADRALMPDAISLVSKPKIWNKICIKLSRKYSFNLCFFWTQAKVERTYSVPSQSLCKTI